MFERVHRVILCLNAKTRTQVLRKLPDVPAKSICPLSTIFFSIDPIKFTAYLTRIKFVYFT